MSYNDTFSRFVAEKLAFNQGVRNRGHIHDNQRRILPRTHPVDALGHEFFSDPGFSQQQHRAVKFEEIGESVAYFCQADSTSDQALVVDGGYAMW